MLVAIDVRGGRVSVAGWTKATQMRPEDVIERMQRRGVRQFVYTNVDRDGMLEGPDLDEVKRIGEIIRGRFLYSGGIGSLEDFRGLCSLRLVNLAGRRVRQGAVRGPLHDRRSARAARCCLGASSRASTWTRAAS